MRSAILVAALAVAVAAAGQEPKPAEWNRLWVKPMRTDGLALTPDGKQVIVAVDRELQVFDAVSGELSGTVETGTRAEHLRYGAKGTLFLLSRGEVRLFYSLAVEPKVIAVKDGSRELSVSPDETLLAVMGYTYGEKESKTYLLLVDVEKAKVRHRIELKGLINEATFSPDGSQVVTASQSGVLDFYDVKSGELARTLKAPAEKTCFSGVAFLPDGKRLVTTDFSRQILIWDLEKGAVEATIPGLQKIQGMTLGKVLMTGHWGGAVRFWDLERKAKVGEIPLPKSVPDTDLRLSADGKRAVFSHGVLNASLEMWTQGKPPARPKREGPWTGRLTGGASSLAFSADGKLLFAAAHGLKLWALDTPGSPSGTSTGSPLDMISWVGRSARNELIVISEQTIRLAHLDEDKKTQPERTIKLKDAKRISYLHAVQLGPKGEQLVLLRSSSDDDDRLELYDLKKKGKLKKVIAKGDLDSSRRLAFDGKRIALATHDGVRLFSARGKTLGTLPELEAGAGLAFAPDGKHLVAVGGRFGDGRVKIVSLKTGKEVRGVDLDPKPHKAWFSPNGESVAVTNKDGNLEIVHLGGLIVSHRLKDVCKGGLDQVGVAFSPDGKQVAVGSQRLERLRVANLADVRLKRGKKKRR